ncbi:MAG: shikimate kinase [Candidatus Omnitrophica bacterium]|nr:shikimate kinase [Candidatus Omnitrophota bacterium]MDD5550652.1 shikimate kinase [Candidatus Omnitrophota bacterium]
MATGKTSVGKELARRLRREFFDLDDLIEQRENKRIVDIFREKGEPYFRKLEKEIIQETSLKKNLVVGCGGGAVASEENLTIFKKSGLVICLAAEIDTILERTKNNTQRPLLNVKHPKEQIKELLTKREPFYKQADYRIDTTGLSVKEVADKVTAIINKDKTK